MATEGTFVQPAVPKFDGHYDHWTMLMENFLRSKEYRGLVENGITAAVEGATDAHKKNIEEHKLKDLKAKNYLFQAIMILETILNKDTAKSIWDSMKQKYHGTTRVKRAQLQALRKEFEILHMKAGESVNEYIARTLIIVNKMKAREVMGNDAVGKILRSMTKKFNYVVCSIEEYKDTSSILSIDELQSSLLVHEQRMGSHDEEEHALKITSIWWTRHNVTNVISLGIFNGNVQAKQRSKLHSDPIGKCIGRCDDKASQTGAVPKF